MYYDFKVKIPEVKGKIYERTIKGVVYINYEYDRVYKPDKKYNIPTNALRSAGNVRMSRK